MTHGVSRLIQAHFDISVMQRHCEISTKGLQKELNELEKIMDKHLKKEDDQDAFFRDVNDLWIDTAETIPRLQWYSQLMIAFGYFEKMMNDVCKEIEVGRTITKSVFDLRGKGITRAKNYLSREVQIKRPFSGQRWQQIKLSSRLRNAIAHNDGYVNYEPENNRSTYSQISRIPHVELNQEIMNQPDAQIVFGSDLIFAVLNNFDGFILDLAEELNRKYE